MHYDFYFGKKAGCDIITMPTQMFKKMNLSGKKPEDYSKETVKMFYKDAKESGYKI